MNKSTKTIDESTMSWTQLSHLYGMKRFVKETRDEFKTRVLNLFAKRAANTQTNHWRKESAH